MLDDPKPKKPVPEDLKVQQLEVYPDDPFADPPVLGSVPFLEALEQRVFDPQQRRDVLVYLHGFDTEFEEALQFTAQLTLNIERTRQRVLKGKYGEAVDDALASSRPLQPVVITWPSDGELVPQLSYWSDRRDAEDSRPAIARILLKLREYLDTQFQERLRRLEGSKTVRGTRDAMRAGDLQCDVRIHLLTQSMGAFVLRHGLQEFRQDPSVAGRPLPQLFDQIMLGAADDDDEVFQNDGKLRPLPDLGRQTTVYFNPDDGALLISMTTKNLGKRLGQNGPKEVITLANLAAVKVTDVLDPGSGDRIGHYYTRLNTGVQSDMVFLMADVPPPLIPGRQPIENNRYRLVAVPTRAKR
ncbi:MAG: alpha/beta hydrolase [Rhodospirillales bacterium]|nr:alpha/beta hydrolase [Rhodospirillales bacterium]